MANHKLSSQDVRAKIISLRDELVLNLEFIESAIRQDRVKLQAYFEEHGDLRYRPVTSKDVDGKPRTYGEPTEIFIEPLATQARTTVKSLLDSIRVIESEILPDDDPEGRQAGSGGGEEAMKARAALRRSFVETAGEVRGVEEPVDTGPVERTPKAEPVEKPVIEEKVKTPSRPSPMREAAEKISAALGPGPERAVKAAPRPWRETKAGADVAPAEAEPKSNVVEAPTGKPKMDPAKVGLSPALRASISGSVAGSRMDEMRKKYEKKGGD
jgi:hypothetical protein